MKVRIFENKDSKIKFTKIYKLFEKYKR